MPEFKIKDFYNVSDLIEIMKILRSENGCPWDREQNHHSIRNNFIEETYEVLEAIDSEDPVLLKEELGDVLLQVVFHAEMESEAGRFDFDGVADDICKKLIVRHPHVFGDVVAKTSDEVLKNWDSIKKETKGQETYTDTLKSVPSVYPALMKAQKLGKRASRAGMDFENEQYALLSLSDEVAELSEAMSAMTYDLDKISDELGDVLFSAVNVARKLDLDAEELLTRACEKFVGRFERVENSTRLDGIDMKSLSINELDAYWQKAKFSC